MGEKERNVEIIEVNKGGSFYKVGFFLLFGLFMFILGAGLTWYFLIAKGQLPVEIALPKILPSPTVITEQIPPAPSITQAIIPTQEELPTSIPPTVAPQKSDLEQIREAMAAKHNKPVSQTNITISKNTGSHVSGGVTFEGEMGGGWLLAAKSGGKWVIVADGNGTISCELIAPYNFPSSIVNECVNNAGKVISR